MEHDEVQVRSRAFLRWEIAALCGVLAIAAVLRAVRMIESFWYDEIAAWSYAQAGPRTILTTLRDPANHILHTLLTWLSIHLVPSGILHDETILRLPAFIASLGSIVFIYLFVRKTLDPRSALLAALIAAVAPVSVLEGAEARGYSLMICFSAAATWQMCRLLELRSWRSAPAIAAIVLYAIFCALGAWAHLLTVFVPIGHALWFAVSAWKRGWRVPRAPIPALALAAIFTLLLYTPVLDDLFAQRATLKRSAADQPAVLGPEGLHALLQLGGSWYWWAAWPGLLCAGIGVCVVVARSRSNRRLLDATVLSLCGLAIMLLVVVAAGTWIYARFTLLAFPGAVLLMTLGLAWLSQRRRSAGMAALLLLVLCFALDLGARPAKQPLREAAQFVLRGRGPDERVLVIGLAHRVMDAYLGHIDVEHSLRHGKDLPEKLQETDPAWVIVLYPRSVAPSRMDLLESKGYEVAAQFRGWVDWGNGDVLVLRGEGQRETR